jgi:Predicted nucleotidyltransferases
VTAQSVALRAIAQAIADALPPEVDEVVVTGSVSRGNADDVSDIELLLVTRDELELTECFALAAAAGLTALGTWGVQGVPTKRVSGYATALRSSSSGGHAPTPRPQSTRSSRASSRHRRRARQRRRAPHVGPAARWQERLGHYPDELAEAWIEDAALTWGGFARRGS